MFDSSFDITFFVLFWGFVQHKRRIHLFELKHLTYPSKLRRRMYLCRRKLHTYPIRRKHPTYQYKRKGQQVRIILIIIIIKTLI